ncbi:MULTISPECIES: oligopeptide:H+ symporter [unclassified Lysobacter]|uniref:peptide MFS transporter n=1 Tax=unclassified Lysobacter TaxID=2635362 RepID=UPI001BEB542F|nr:MULTISPECIES: oligopeptide:H+ symporter [unclassified Lysobacter]MBT2746472.1 MFS transporter [Lysobacter sp. ISL-42]MBT2753631.1 MFS transporter [Lysobacter sp. ISL-50]MBT2779930.1 MFS transporter [Lysobacter sp. ISL-54]MBT2784691.1 MFS transporter [Lysobacter sp. ISL-52]
MSGAATSIQGQAPIPEFEQRLGHPKPLWMLFMTEFWERFAFYGIRWALVLYIVAQFYGGDGVGQAPANRIYGAYLALVYAAAIFGGYIADRVLGYQRSILLGAVIMSAGLFMIAFPNEQVFKFGLATIICGNGLFKPNISTMVGKLYAVGDERRDSGFTIFYMGINLGGFLSPILTGWLAEQVFGTSAMPAYKMVFLASGVGMLISLFWFWFGRRQLEGIGRPPADSQGKQKVLYVFLGALAAIPVVYFLLALGAGTLQWVLLAMFVALCGLLLFEGFREGSAQRDKVIAMLIIFTFNILFWMFFEQAGSSFTFLADQIVDRQFSGGFVFPNAWFQSVNSLAIIALAPIIAWIWVAMRNTNPSIPRKFGLGLIFNGLAFLLLVVVLTPLVVPAMGLESLPSWLKWAPSVSPDSAFAAAPGKIPFWSLFMVYVIQSVGELCLSPIGLSMVTKLAPVRLVGFGMGGWFLSTGIGNNLSGIFAGEVSGEKGMSTATALTGYGFGFMVLVGAGLLLFLVAPLVQKLMHGVK